MTSALSFNLHSYLNLLGCKQILGQLAGLLLFTGRDGQSLSTWKPLCSHLFSLLHLLAHSEALTTQRFMFGGNKFFIAHDTLNGNTGVYDTLMCTELEILVNQSTGGWNFSIYSKIFLFLEDSRRKNCCLNQSQVQYDFFFNIYKNECCAERGGSFSICQHILYNHA